MPKIISQIMRLDFKPHHIFNKSAMIIGPTKTGKSRCALFLCHCVHDLIDIVIVFCPTAAISHDWDDVAPKCCIRNDLNDETLTNIIDDQIKKCEYIDLATDDDHYNKYWNDLPGSRAIDNQYTEKIREIDESISKQKGITDEERNALEFEKEKALVERNAQSRKLILKYTKGLFRKYNVTNKDTCEVAVSLRIFCGYFRLNKNMLLVIDDCTDILPKVSNDTWTRLFQKNRWFRITVVMNVHTIGHIKHQSLRQGPFWFIFATSTMVTMFIETKNCGMKGNINPDIRALGESFKHDKEKKVMQKVAINREEMIICKFTFPLNLSFRLGSDIFWEYDKMQEDKKKNTRQQIDLRMI